MNAETAQTARDDAAAQQVADALRARLISSEEGWRFEQRISSEARIAQELGVSQTAVAAGLRVLADQGWLEPAGAHRMVVRRRVGPIPGSA